MKTRTTMTDGRAAFGFSLEISDPRTAAGDVSRLLERLAVFFAAARAGPMEKNAGYTAVEELLTNLGKFGRAPGGKPVAVEGEAVLDGGGLTILLTDDSEPFDPTRAATPDVFAEAAERNEGGLGLFMLKEMFGEVEYRREGGKNIGRWRRARE